MVLSYSHNTYKQLSSKASFGTAYDSPPINTQESRNSHKGDNKKSSQESVELKRQKAEELKCLIADARNTPPEVAADTLFQLIESGIITDDNRKHELLEEIFNLAYSTQYKLKRYDSNNNTDTRSGMLSYGYSLNLDTLSLQCKSVRGMIVLDKKKAREHFEKIIIPTLTPLSCEDSMVYDVSIYYDTLSDILHSTFTEAEVKQQKHIHLVNQAITNITSSLQFGPIAKVITSLDLPPRELSHLVRPFNNRLNNLSSDARSFTWAIRSLGGDVKNLATHCKNKGVVFDRLLGSYRSFLLNNMTNNWCDGDINKSQMITFVKKEVGFFNSQITDLVIGGNTSISPLQINKLLPKGVGKSAHIYEYWKTPLGEKLLRGIQKLNYGKDGKKRSLIERNEVTWQHELADYYNNLKSWTKAKADGMTEVDFFHQKCNLFGLLLELTPQSDPQYKDILVDYVDFLSQNHSKQVSVVEWLWQANIPFLRMKNITQLSDDILKAYVKSNDHILRTIAKTKLFIAKHRRPSQSET